MVAPNGAMGGTFENIPQLLNSGESGERIQQFEAAK
jgi:hypothetical protein